jgi:hypothetical protein
LAEPPELPSSARTRARRERRAREQSISVWLRRLQASRTR